MELIAYHDDDESVIKADLNGSLMGTWKDCDASLTILRVKLGKAKPLINE